MNFIKAFFLKKFFDISPYFACNGFIWINYRIYVRLFSKNGDLSYRRIVINFCAGCLQLHKILRSDYAVINTRVGHFCCFIAKSRLFFMNCKIFK